MKGRGAGLNTPNRFEKLHYEDASDEGVEQKNFIKTQYLKDNSKTILTYNKSPDVGFEVGLNAYRGCEHGCIYCYARPTHEYLGMSAGIDFETRIVVKENAPDLLRKELLSRKWKPQTIMMSGNTDCYQPIEKKLELTRGCLKVLNEFKNPVSMITKNALVIRDLDILSELASVSAAAVFVTITSLDAKLCGVLEPRTSRPEFRLQAIRELSKAGVPVGVMIAPVIPGLTDHEMPEILNEAAVAGAKFSGFVPLRLPLAVAPLFEQWLSEHFPERKEKVIHRVREVRGGKLNDSNFSSRMRGQGNYAEQIRNMYTVYSRRAGLNQESLHLSTASFQLPPIPPLNPGQLSLF